AGEPNVQGIRLAIAPGSPGSTTGVSNLYGDATLFTAVGGWSVTCDTPDSLTVTNGNPQSGSMANRGSASVAFGLRHQSVGHVQGKVFLDANRNRRCAR